MKSYKSKYTIIKIENIHNVILYILLCISSVTIYAQNNTQLNTNYQDINIEGINQNLKAMNVSGTWSGISVLSGGIGYFTTDDSRWKAFHATNFSFGVLNALVVMKGRSDLQKGKLSNWSFRKSIREHRKIERLYVFNNGFNYAFIFGGLLLKEKGKTSDPNSKKRILQGLGDALITQGIFFLAFDTTMYFVQKNYNDNKLGKIIPDEIEVSIGQIGFKWNLN